MSDPLYWDVSITIPGGGTGTGILSASGFAMLTTITGDVNDPYTVAVIDKDSKPLAGRQIAAAGESVITQMYPIKGATTFVIVGTPAAVMNVRVWRKPPE